ncbi:MAG: hypothetical protein GY757_56620 [bacterium]|nr:hypothetical protein [bacterium]
MIVEAQKNDDGLFIPIVKQLEQKHREGYLRHPVEPGEFSDFEEEQVWID